MRLQYVAVTTIGLCIAALSAWLVVSLLNDLSGGATPVVPVVSVQSEAPEASPPETVETASAMGDDAAAPVVSEADAGEGGAGTGDAPADEAGTEKVMDRLAEQEPAAPAPRVLPPEAGPYRAAFIREPPSEAEFPQIMLGDALWRVRNVADGSVSGEVDIVAVDQEQRATLQVSSAVSSDGGVVFLLTLTLGEGEFLPEAGSVIIEAITARGRGNRSVRIPTTTLPYEDPRVVDFRAPADEILATFSFAQWLDVGLRMDGALYTITIQNSDATRDILSAVAYGL